MTEEQIELRVQYRTDAIDRAYMAGGFTTEQYREIMADLDKWAERQFALSTRPREPRA